MPKNIVFGQNSYLISTLTDELKFTVTDIACEAFAIANLLEDLRLAEGAAEGEARRLILASQNHLCSIRSLVNRSRLLSFLPDPPDPRMTAPEQFDLPGPDRLA